ncbi:MAG: divalent cation tolerance protein CutA [Candidatus Woesearchaeota archaeon]
MDKGKPIFIFLTCTDKKEAEKITNHLLYKKLSVCIKGFPVRSMYLWHGKKEKSKEYLLIIESLENLFEKIEREVGKIHSYSQPAIIAIPIIKTTKGVKAWIKREVRQHESTKKTHH